MSDLILRIHPGLHAQWRQSFPQADLNRFVAEAMTAAIRDKRRQDEDERWAQVAARTVRVVG